MSDAHAPLTWETSTHTQPQLATSLPSEVVNCLENARYLHLATCTELQPHVALMNYTYLPSHPFADSSSQMPINGNAIVLPVGSEEEKWCKLQHLENNTFEREETSQNVLSATPSNAEDEEASRQSFLKDEDIRVVVVRIREGRIADWKGGVKDWVLAPAEGAGNLVNGL
ncbi:hypothetical protein D6D27_01443 [Aureobasidium pullulans]|nr:hypothetical protein D6D27_01443 [Aureobasidium pullulans]